MAWTTHADAQPVPACNDAAGPTAFVPLPGSPFAAVTTPDGCTIFVSLTGDFPGQRNGIAVLRREGGKMSLERLIGDQDTPYGMVLTRDGKFLIVANNTNVVVLDAGAMATGKGDLLAGYVAESGSANPLNINVNVSPDGRFLFVAEENADRISVIDLEHARATGFTDTMVVGTIPAGVAPIALTFSPDGKFLYLTVQQAPDNDRWPAACKPEGEDPATATAEAPEGAVVVVDVARAETDPEHAVLAKIPAGCSPVRLAVSPDGGRAYVTARGDNALHVFDTAKLIADAEHARIVSIPVGISPVGVAVIDGGKKIAVANSNRFAAGPQASETVSVIDAAKLSVIGTIPAGAFPRELSVTADGKTLLITNSGSDSLELVDLARLPFAP
jgi:YVTN family beta-propeller protein